MGGEASLQSITERGRPRDNSASTSGSVGPPTSASAQELFRKHQARGWPHKRALSRHPGAPSQDVGPPLCAPRFLSLAVAGEVPKLPDHFWRHKARTHKPVLNELADLLSVLDVGLPAGNVPLRCRAFRSHNSKSSSSM